MSRWIHKEFMGEPFATHDGCFKAVFLYRSLSAIQGPCWECQTCGSLEPATLQEIAFQEQLQASPPPEFEYVPPIIVPPSCVHCGGEVEQNRSVCDNCDVLALEGWTPARRGLVSDYSPFDGEINPVTGEPFEDPFAEPVRRAG